jgi:hypothetical protein
MELIGKQIAIETILGQPPELHYPSWYAAQIEKLPPAPPEYLAEQAGILVTDDDTISRKAAIEAVEFGITYAKAINKETGEVIALFEESNAELKEAVNRIKQLPPAQPEQLEQCPIYGGMCAYPSNQCYDCPRHAGAKMEVTT